ncbi:hypothetical protein NDU88_004473 [Pleurodeles waltl]|uniref:Uncharacterized protein n=1 Tax=Pleurodeles waltl TaxID=8319 RepID=A0AAV7M7M2_PLEWA|nr:hypothetical protein NDU88_004473 [Pleurodeles waltl]
MRVRSAQGHSCRVVPTPGSLPSHPGIGRGPACLATWNSVDNCVQLDFADLVQRGCSACCMGPKVGTPRLSVSIRGGSVGHPGCWEAAGEGASRNVNQSGRSAQREVVEYKRVTCGGWRV